MVIYSIVFQGKTEAISASAALKTEILSPFLCPKTVQGSAHTIRNNDHNLLRDLFDEQPSEKPNYLWECQACWAFKP